MNTKQIVENSLKLTLILEYYGIRMEDTKELDGVTYQYISVPESSTIVTEDQEVNDRIKTSDGLVALAKDMLIKMQLDTCREIFGADDDIEEILAEMKSTVSDWLKIYARVRKGEVWTEEMAKARLNELGAELREANEYKEV